MSNSTNAINVSDSAEKRLIFLIGKEDKPNSMLRIAIMGGGCAGFQYVFNLDNQMNKDDFVIQKNGNKLVVIDETSLNFIKGSTVDFIEELGASYFKILNPNISSSCGCGSSFAV